jgi:hypothetical protein
MEDRNNNKGKSEIFSKAVRAGKRTYFFDVKSTKDGNLYLTVTESKRRLRHDGNGFFYEKHKVFLYKEDFIKFSDGLSEVVDYIRKNNPTPVEEQVYVPNAEHHNHHENDNHENGAEVTGGGGSDFSSDLDFEDLDK